MKTNIQPNESQIVRAEPETPPVISFIIKYSCGLIKNQNQALYLMLSFTGIIIILSLFFIFSANKTKPKPEPDIFNRPSQLQPVKQR